MTRKATLRTLSQMSEINLTPLMDLTFLLLITFIITFPLIEQGIRVNLPKGHAAELPQRKTHTITIDLAGSFFLNNSPLSRDDLAREMAALGTHEPESVVLVRADESLRYGEVVKLLKILHDSRITRMALVTQAADELRR